MMPRLGRHESPMKSGFLVKETPFYWNFIGGAELKICNKKKYIYIIYILYFVLKNENIYIYVSCFHSL